MLSCGAILLLSSHPKKVWRLPNKSVVQLSKSVEKAAERFTFLTKLFGTPTLCNSVGVLCFILFITEPSNHTRAVSWNVFCVFVCVCVCACFFVCLFFVWRFIKRCTCRDTRGTSGGVMVSKLDSQTYTSEFESHWVPHSFGLVLNRSKDLRKLLHAETRANKNDKNGCDCPTII